MSLRQEDNMEKLLLTAEEAAAVVGVSRTKMFELIRVGAVESVRIGSCRRIPSAALRQYVEMLREDAQAALL